MNSQEKCIVQCPFCQTRFYIWLSLFVERRSVKCSSCGNTWFQDPTEHEKAGPNLERDIRHTKNLSLSVEEKKIKTSSDQSLKPMRFIVNEPSHKDRMEPVPGFERDSRFLEEDPVSKKKYRKRFSFAIFMIPLLIFIFARDYLIRIEPSLVSIYKILGLSLRDFQEGFEVRNTAWHEVLDKGVPSLVVSGELANMSLQLKIAPTIRVRIRGAGGCHPMDLAAYVFGDEKAQGHDGLCVMDQWTLNVSYDRLLPGQVVPFETIHPYDGQHKIEKVQIDFVE